MVANGGDIVSFGTQFSTSILYKKAGMAVVPHRCDTNASANFSPFFLTKAAKFLQETLFGYIGFSLFLFGIF